MGLKPIGLAWHAIDMPKRIKQRPADVNQLAPYLADLSTTGQHESIKPPTRSQISWLMAQLGRKGGRIGGKRRLQTMTSEERTRVAKRAAEARWQERRTK
jgi:hypothetical protein